MKNKTIRSVVCICLVALLLCGGIAYGAIRYIDGRIQQLGQASIANLDSVSMKAEAAEENGVSSVASLKLNPRSGDLLDPTEIYELACQQVVGVTTELTSTNTFGQVVTGSVTGTGFIISSDGYILTNNHVVEDAYEWNLKVTVIMHDGTEYEAQIVGVESDNNDIAVLKIEATGLSAATLGNSDDMKVGESVYLCVNDAKTEITLSSAITADSGLNGMGGFGGFGGFGGQGMNGPGGMGGGPGGMGGGPGGMGGPGNGGSRP